MTPLNVLRATLLVLLLAAVAWFVRARLWRQKRLWPIGVALLIGLGVLSRRIGFGELLVLAVVIVVPAILLGPGKR